MIDPRDERIWAKAFNALLSGGQCANASEARAKADQALKEHKDRWPVEHSMAVPIGGLDAGMILRAVSQLEAERRIDAALVLKSLYESLRAAQSRGERLLLWEPPPRGGQILSPPKPSGG